MRRYLASLDLSNQTDHAKLLAVYTDLLQGIARHRGIYATEAHSDLQRWIHTLTANGFRVDSETFAVNDDSGPRTIGLTSGGLTAPSDPSVIHDHLHRLGDTVDTDPRLAVSTAKAFLWILRSSQGAPLAARYPSGKPPRLSHQRPTVFTNLDSEASSRGPLSTHSAASSTLWPMRTSAR